MAKMNIDITKVVKIAANKALDEFQYKGNTTREWADKIASGEYQPVKRGRWVERDGDLYGFTFYCSECGEVAPLDKFEERILSDFCPFCGAKMDGGVK